LSGDPRRTPYMTAHDLIDSIFSRPQLGLAGNMRRITPAQLKYLRDLIGQDPEGASVCPGAANSLVWMPSGRWKYVLTEDPIGNKHTLTRLGNLVASEAGRLF
jgi:hypothetical protein